MGEEIFPGNLAPLVTRHAAEHAAESGFHTSGDLVVRGAGGNAVDEGTLLFPVGEGEIVGEAAVGCELAGP